jgi:NAD(P)-dependent dehydrogenase (short-subunit alcohol dehydrogenase family)
MRSFNGRTAFITGGASGFGLALAQELAALGMNIMIGDIDEAALQSAVSALRATGACVGAVLCDVTERASMVATAEQTRARFGNVHLLCNNAGVLVAGSGDQLSPGDWDWIFAVNVMGVVNGLAAFLPGMLAHGEDAHVLNTASYAGLMGFAYSGPYCATKSAVVALTEAVRSELETTPIGVTALCPNFMRTPFFSSGTKRQARFGGPKDVWSTVNNDTREQLSREMEAGLDPAAIARIAIAGIRDNRFIVVTHPEGRALLEQRYEDLMQSYDWLDTLLATAA